MPDLKAAFRATAIVLGALALYACATPSYPPPPRSEGVVPPPPLPPELSPPLSPLPVAVTDLPGWASDDHVAAFAAFRAACAVTADPDLTAVCRSAPAAGALGEAEARAFFEDNFQAWPEPGEGLLTAYFAPEYEARAKPDHTFTAPVRAKPDDLPPPGGPPYADRATIEALPPQQPLAWMRPEDLFFLQVQGSGVLDFPSGIHMRASFAGSNGQPFVPISAVLRANGALPANGASAQAVHDWLAEHRGPDADAVMRADPRYVFFGLTFDDGDEPVGTAGIPLIAGRSVAVDAREHPLGGLFWISADDPTLTGAAPAYHRVVAGLDTGGAITGTVRADLYLGRGPAAGLEAGRVRHRLRLYQLRPRRAPGS